jgi:hypothetical protein
VAVRCGLRWRLAWIQTPYLSRILTERWGLFNNRMFWTEIPMLIDSVEET